MPSKPHYAILGEDRSDAETVRVLIKRLAGNQAISSKIKGYGGGPMMLRKGTKDLQAMVRLGCKRIVIVYDADKLPANRARQKVIKRVAEPAGINKTCCIVIPVQEIEAWILADLQAVQFVITGWKPKKQFNSPEKIKDPKEVIESLSLASNKKPRYSHKTHNERVAQHLDLNKVERKCPSFRPLVDLVRKGVGNYP